jgi:hypothetical protein
MLDTWFNEVGMDLVGIQEGRLPSAGRRRGVHFIMLCAQADQHGSGGVQVWVSINLAKHIVAEVVVNPWIMYVCLKLHFPLYFVCAHAPHEGVSKQRKLDFWDKLDATLTGIRRLCEKAIVILSIDANAHTGSATCTAIGNFDPEDESDNGESLRGLLTTHGLVAANTHFPAGPTWTGSRGHRSRIDYVCIPDHMLERVSSCRILSEIDLATAFRDDHESVAVLLHDLLALVPAGGDCAGVAPATRNSRKIRPACWALQDPACICFFQRNIGDFARPLTDDPSVWLDAWVEHTRDAACKSFPVHQQRPKKSWISHRSWVAIRAIADQRRMIRRLMLQNRTALTWVFFHIWRLASARVFVVGTYEYAQQLLCWCNSVLRQSDNQLSLAQFVLSRQLQFKKASVVFDRHASLSGIALAAQSAADRGNVTSTYKLIRSLGGVKPMAFKGVRGTDGLVITDAEVAKRRWQEHFASLFVADVLDEVAHLCRPTGVDAPSHAFKPTVDMVIKAICSLSSRKAAGRDGLCAGILRAGGYALARQLAELIWLIIDTECVPYQWRGGTILDLYKGKGDPLDCNSSRGLLISDHALKVLTSLLH